MAFKKWIVYSILKRSLSIIPTKILKNNTVWFLQKKKEETKRSKLRLKKPDSDDKIGLVNELSTNTAKVLALCFSVSDKMGSSSSDFLKCVSCDLFVGTSSEGSDKCSGCRG